MKTLKYLSFITLFLVSIGSFAQKREFDLAVDYKLTPADKSKLVSNVYALGADTVALPWAWKAKKAQGITYTQFRQIYIAAAYILDATWANEAPNNIGKFQNAFNFIKAPAGGWYINTNCPLPRGGMEGKGSFYYYGENSVTTEFIMDDSNWIGSGTERIMFSTPNWQNTSNAGYNESFSITNLCLDGPGKRGDGITRIGLALGKAGECTYVNQIRSDRFNYGFVASGGVPLTIGTITAFHNDLGGFVGLGCAQSTIAIGTLSGDSNGELFGLHAGYGLPAGGIVTIGGLAKSEDGVTDEARGAWLGQILAYCEGQYSVTIANYSCAASNIVGDAIFVLNPSIPAYGMQQSNLEAKGYSFGYRTLILDLQAHTRIPLPGDYYSLKFIHQAGQGMWTPFPNIIPSAVSCNCTAPLGFLRKSTTTGLPIGSFDYVGCSPKKGTSSSTTTPPVTPVVTSVSVTVSPTSVVLGSTSQATAVVKDQNGNTMTGQTVNWSITSGGATVNSSGLITTTAVGSIVVKATVGSVSSTTNLTVTASGGGGGGSTAKYTLSSNFALPYTTNSNSCVGKDSQTPGGNTVLSVTGVTKVILTFTPTNVTNAYGRVLGTGAGLPSLQIYNGYFWYNGIKCTMSITGPLVANTKYTDLTVNLPSAITVTAIFQTDCAQGGAQQGKFDKLELY